MTGAGWTGGCVSQNDIISVGVLIWPQLTHKSPDLITTHSSSWLSSLQYNGRGRSSKILDIIIL